MGIRDDCAHLWLSQLHSLEILKLSPPQLSPIPISSLTIFNYVYIYIYICRDMSMHFYIYKCERIEICLYIVCLFVYVCVCVCVCVCLHTCVSQTRDLSLYHCAAVLNRQFFSITIVPFRRPPRLCLFLVFFCG